MATFQPSPEDTQNIIRLLHDSRSPNPQVMQTIQQQLETYNKMHNFNSYLAFIMQSMKDQPVEIRCVAGLLLKRNIGNFFQNLTESLKFIQQSLLQGLTDPSRDIRNTVSNCIATMTRIGGLRCWFVNELDLTKCLCQLLDSGSAEGVDGALSTIVKLCEDVADQLDLEPFGRPVNYLVPKLVQFLAHGEVTVRKNALHSIVKLLEASSYGGDTGASIMNVMIANLEAFLDNIFKLANDNNTSIKKDVCRSFVALLACYQKVKPFMSGIINYMLQQTQSDDESLALEACEFWSVIAEMEMASSELQPVIPQLLPVLLKGMVYNEYDRLELGGDEDDAHIADKEEHIHPHLINKAARAKVAHGGNDDDDDDEEVSDWNLRKCSASSLDVLSSSYGDPLLEVLLPLIEARMAANNPWEVRESAILAMGAVAEGCYSGMQKHLPGLIPYLIQVLNTDSKPLVRSITCWTLSRYSRWVVSESSSDRSRYFEPLLKVLMDRVLDNNKKVQEAACSAFAAFEEEAQSDLIDYLEPILQCLRQAFTKYQAKNLFILYDAVVTLSDAVQRKLNQPHLIQIIMPPLVEKWQSIKDDDRALFPLLACLTSVAQAIGPGFMEFAGPVFGRCTQLIGRHFHALQNPNMEAPDREFVVCSLDMLSGLADGLEQQLEPFVANSNLTHLLLECMKDEAYDVRQSSFAFLGDLAKICMPHLMNLLPQYMHILVSNLQPHPVSVCNNAAWAIGEIAVKIGEDIGQYVPAIVDLLIPIMNQPLNRNLLENTGITLGRLGLVCSDKVAPRLQEFIQPWCFNLRNIRNDIEKEHAFQGLCQMIRKNPNGVFHAFAYVCDAFASWGEPKQELREEFGAILQGFRQHIGDQWPTYYSQFPTLLKEHLSRVYGLGA